MTSSEVTEDKERFVVRLQKIRRDSYSEVMKEESMHILTHKWNKYVSISGDALAATIIHPLIIIAARNMCEQSGLQHVPSVKKVSARVN